MNICYSDKRLLFSTTYGPALQEKSQHPITPFRSGAEDFLKLVRVLEGHQCYPQADGKVLNSKMRNGFSCILMAKDQYIQQVKYT